MKFIDYDSTTQAFILKKTEKPRCLENQVLIKVYYAGVSRPDVLQAKGFYAPPADASPILGLEVSGLVEDVGQNVSSEYIGQEVCALVHGGGYAEFVICDVDHILSIPPHWSLCEAASFPEAFFTAALYCRKLRDFSHKKILINPGLSGVALAFLQIFSAFSCDMTCLSRRLNFYRWPEIKDLATWVVVSDSNSFPQSIESQFDLVIDFLGGAYLSQHFSSLKNYGELWLLGAMSSIKSEILLTDLIRKNLKLRALSLRGQPFDIKKQCRDFIVETVYPLCEKKKVQPLVDQLFSFSSEGVKAAHQYVLTSGRVGRLILDLGQERKDY